MDSPMQFRPDIAVLELMQPLKINEKVQFVCLPEDYLQNSYWGYTAGLNTTSLDTLKLGSKATLKSNFTEEEVYKNRHGFRKSDDLKCKDDHMKLKSTL